MEVINMVNKSRIISIKDLQEVIDYLENNRDKWLREEESTITWFENCIENLKQGKRIFNLRNVMGARKRILGDESTLRYPTAKEVKAENEVLKKKLNDAKNEMWKLREEARDSGSEEEYEKYKELHAAAMQAEINFIKNN